MTQKLLIKTLLTFGKCLNFQKTCLLAMTEGTGNYKDNQCLWLLPEQHTNNVFLDPSPWATATKAKINKRDSIQLKSFCISKETINKMKR